MTVPIFDKLLKILDVGPIGDLNYIITISRELQISMAGFQNWFGDV